MSISRIQRMRLERMKVTVLVLMAACMGGTPHARAQDEDPSYSVNALMKLQAGMFAPGVSSGYRPYANVATLVSSTGIDSGVPCDPVYQPSKPCFPQDHGKQPGSPSIARATLQLEAHWDVSSKLALHAIVRAVRSAPLLADEYAQVPLLLPQAPNQTPDEVSDARRAYAKGYAHQNYYNEVDLREFYLDLWPTDWLTFRVGRQQVAWGETGQFRLLDVVNPSDNTWHFGALESFEDQRVPLWMLLTTLEIPRIRSSLELLYIPGIDRREDLVNAPLSMVGAWGLPYSNKPSPYQMNYKDFQYPGGELNPAYMRGGTRLNGSLGTTGSYSLVYMYTHMMDPTLSMVELKPLPTGGYDPDVAQRAELIYPRRHVVGGSLEWSTPSPLASVLRFEGALEPNRTFSPNTNEQGSAGTDGRIVYTPGTKPVLNYALVFQRPTLIRWLNPTQNILLIAQFMHTHVFDLDEVADADLVQVIGYNDWAIQKNSYTVVAHARTSYMHGRVTPRITGVLMHNPQYGQSGLLSFELDFRFGDRYQASIRRTNFFGVNAYRDLGLFRDRDEIHASFSVFL